MKIVFIVSIACNITLVCFLGCRYIYLHSRGNAGDSSLRFHDMWNSGREDVLGPLPIDTGDAVFVGNSITEGFPLEEMFQSLKVKNRGISGNRSCHIMVRIDEIARAHPAKIFLDIGVNDILAHVPIDSLKIHYKIIVNSIFSGSPNTKIYIQSVFPLGASHAVEEKTVEEFNTWLKGYCQDTNTPYIDLFPAYVKNGLLDPDLSFDDIHLNGLGYRIWKHKLQTYL